jgi:hypothetical protein
MVVEIDARIFEAVIIVRLWNIPLPYKDVQKNRLSKMRWWRDRLDIIIGYLGGICIKCGSVNDLEIDHINPKDKDFNISHHADRKVEFLEAEIDKCQLLCHNCHMDKTIIERGGQRVRCGTNTGYSQGCRCPLCKEAHSKYHKKHYQSKRCQNI